MPYSATKIRPDRWILQPQAALYIFRKPADMTQQTIIVNIWFKLIYLLGLKDYGELHDTTRLSVCNFFQHRAVPSRSTRIMDDASTAAYSTSRDCIYPKDVNG